METRVPQQKKRRCLSTAKFREETSCSRAKLMLRRNIYGIPSLYATAQTGSWVVLAFDLVDPGLQKQQSDGAAAALTAARATAGRMNPAQLRALREIGRK